MLWIAQVLETVKIVDMFTVSVIFGGQILYRYYKAYLQFRLICDKLEILQVLKLRKSCAQKLNHTSCEYKFYEYIFNSFKTLQTN